MHCCIGVNGSILPLLRSPTTPLLRLASLRVFDAWHFDVSVAQLLVMTSIFCHCEASSEAVAISESQ